MNLKMYSRKMENYEDKVVQKMEELDACMGINKGEMDCYHKRTWPFDNWVVTDLMI